VLFRSQAHLRPQALLDTALAASMASNGPYRYAGRDGTEETYLLAAAYFAATATQPKEIVQRHFAGGTAAAAALRRGEVHVLDRVNPWQVKSLRADTSLTVAPYVLPRLHCLIPNPTKLLPSSRTFRRALAYGIDRQAILDQLLQGDKLPGCAVADGLFPTVRADEKPWPYDPRMALVLAETARREAAAAAKGRGPASSTVLVLAHSRDEVARTACMAIQRQLATIGVEIELRETPAAVSGRIPANADLLYVELAFWEPLVDAPWVLGDGGLSGGSTAAMSQAFGQLAEAADGNELAARLRRVDAVARDEASILPLWQLSDYFACQKGLAGIGIKTVTLYQDVEQWKVQFHYPDEP
jgi:ABC-type transport system substrate-binding protein